MKIELDLTIEDASKLAAAIRDSNIAEDAKALSIAKIYTARRSEAIITHREKLIDLISQMLTYSTDRDLNDVLDGIKSTVDELSVYLPDRWIPGVVKRNRDE